MNRLYKISVAGPDSDVILATADVEVSDTGARIIEIRTESDGNSAVPQQLKDINFSLLIQTASILSGHIAPDDRSTTSKEASSGAKDELQAPGILDQPQQETVVSRTASTINDTRENHNRQPSKTDMPSDFGVNYWRLGSISKVAKHYDVPHHIAQDWIKTLQREGKAARPWPSKGNRPLR
jgi:hypothetical protein